MVPAIAEQIEETQGNGRPSKGTSGFTPEDDVLLGGAEMVDEDPTVRGFSLRPEGDETRVEDREGVDRETVDCGPGSLVDVRLELCEEPNRLA